MQCALGNVTYSGGKAASIDYFMPSGSAGSRDCGRVGYCCRTGKGGTPFGACVLERSRGRPAMARVPQWFAALLYAGDLYRDAHAKIRGLGRLAFSGQLYLSYFMLRAAGSGTRHGPLAESGNRVPNEDACDYSGSRCSAQYPRALSSASGKRSCAPARLSPPR